MATQQNFNASDAILQLAQRAGQGQLRQRRFDEGRALVQDAQARMAQTEALRLESRRLELAAQQARLGSNSASRSVARSNPFTRSVQEANAEFKAPQINQRTTQFGATPGAGSISGEGASFRIDEEGNLSGTIDGQPATVVNEQAIEGRRGGFTQGRAPGGQTPLAAAKQGLLENSGLDPQTQQSLQNAALSEDVDTARFINIIQDAKRLTADPEQPGLTVNQQGVFQERAIRNQVADVDTAIQSIEKRLSEDFSINIAGRSAEDIEALGARVPGRFFDTPADPQLQELVSQLQQLRQQKEQLRSQQQSFVSELIGQQAPPPNADTNEDLTQSSLADLLRAATGQ